MKAPANGQAGRASRLTFAPPDKKFTVSTQSVVAGLFQNVQGRKPFMDRTFISLPLALTILFTSGILQGSESPLQIGSRRELFVDRYLIESLIGGATLRLHAPIAREQVIDLRKALGRCLLGLHDCNSGKGPFSHVLPWPA